jgi:hypothetical protein
MPSPRTTCGTSSFTNWCRFTSTAAHYLEDKTSVLVVFAEKTRLSGMEILDYLSSLGALSYSYVPSVPTQYTYTGVPD